VSGAPHLAANLAAQARLRLGLAAVCIAAWLAVADYAGLLTNFSIVLAFLHLAYAGVTVLITHRWRIVRSATLVYATAILDPLILSGWVIAGREFGGIVIGLYLFTIVGYAIRIGSKRLLRVCHAASMAGFIGAALIEPYWQAHVVQWVSFFVALAAVPFYVQVLMIRLHAAIALAERESQAKSALLARVSHELRTPLTGMLASAEILARESAGERPRRLAETILALGRDLLHEINDLLDEAKYEADALALAPAPISLQGVGDTVQATLAGQAVQKRIDLDVSTDPRLDGPVIGDAHYLTRILINLAGNAVKFTDYGRVALRMALLESAADEVLVRFSVEDTGPGIPKDWMEKIFEPFVQVAGAKRLAGTGLGLTIARHLVQLMGGTLQVSSQIGRGSTFRFDLRMRRAPQPARALPPPEASAPSGRRILIVDDYETNLLLLRELLEIDHHRVATAASGAAALELLSGQDFDAVFLDFNLGDMDGLTVLQTYRFGRADAAPVFFLTADASPATAARLRDAGAAGVLYKPVGLKELRASVAEACGQPAQPETAEPAAIENPLRVVPITYVDMEEIGRLRSIALRKGFLAEILRRADADIAKNCEAILGALGSGEMALAKDAAHALKGVCSTVGAVRLTNLCLTLMRTDNASLALVAGKLGAEIGETGRLTRRALAEIRAAEEPAPAASNGATPG